MFAACCVLATSQQALILLPDAARAGTEQVLTVNNERFMVPEALFHPSDIGMRQAGAQL